MCSTAIDAYPAVPRDDLVTAINGRTQHRFARSDKVPTGNVAADARAGALPAGTFTAINEDGCGYIDYFM